MDTMKTAVVVIIVVVLLNGRLGVYSIKTLLNFSLAAVFGLAITQKNYKNVQTCYL